MATVQCVGHACVGDAYDIETAKAVSEAFVDIATKELGEACKADDITRIINQETCGISAMPIYHTWTVAGVRGALTHSLTATVPNNSYSIGFNQQLCMC